MCSHSVGYFSLLSLRIVLAGSRLVIFQLWACWSSSCEDKVVTGGGPLDGGDICIYFLLSVLWFHFPVSVWSLSDRTMCLVWIGPFVCRVRLFC